MNVLLVRAGALGDVLLLRTAIAALRVAGHRVALLAPSRAGAALVGSGPGEVESVLDWESPRFARLMGGSDEAGTAIGDAVAQFDAIVAFTASDDLARGLREAAPSARVVTHPPMPPAGGPHAGRWLTEAVLALGAEPLVIPPVLAPTADEGALARPWLDRVGGDGFLAIHPGSGSPRKNWPTDRFAAVVEARAGGRPWLLVEGPADREAAATLACLPGAVHARDLPARVLGAVLAKAGLYVGNDSGVSHLAAAWGAPAVVLFGPTDPALWLPVGPRVRAVASADGSMAGIAVSAVTSAQIL